MLRVWSMPAVAPDDYAQTWTLCCSIRIQVVLYCHITMKTYSRHRRVVYLPRTKYTPWYWAVARQGWRQSCWARPVQSWAFWIFLHLWLDDKCLTCHCFYRKKNSLSNPLNNGLLKVKFFWVMVASCSSMNTMSISNHGLTTVKSFNWLYFSFGQFNRFKEIIWFKLLAKNS